MVTPWKITKKFREEWGLPITAVKWLLNGGPDVTVFMNKYFGQQPLKITRNDKQYYEKMHLDLTLSKIKTIGKEYGLYHGIDIISKHCINDSETCPEWIVNKQEEQSRLEMTDKIDEISKIMNLGLTLQYHHPQHRYYEIMDLLYKLESWFNVCIGCNVYITPNNTQGLAPHWDDVDVWILQIEGKKHWKLYTNGLNGQPIESSGDLDLKKDCPNAKLIMECDLEPGDLLYLPRGTVMFSVGIFISLHKTKKLADPCTIFRFYFVLLF